MNSKWTRCLLFLCCAPCPNLIGAHAIWRNLVLRANKQTKRNKELKERTFPTFFTPTPVFPVFAFLLYLFPQFLGASVSNFQMLQKALLHLFWTFLHHAVRVTNAVKLFGFLTWITFCAVSAQGWFDRQVQELWSIARFDVEAQLNISGIVNANLCVQQERLSVSRSHCKVTVSVQAGHKSQLRDNVHNDKDSDSNATFCNKQR